MINGAHTNKKIAQAIIALLVVLFFAACGNEADAISSMYDYVDGYVTHEDYEEEARKGYGQENSVDDVVEIRLTHGFDAIFNAYADFERSGFLDFDEDLITFTHFSNQSHWEATRPVPNGAIWTPPDRHFLYAFHDMSGNGVPDLFIGGTGANWERVQLIAVYTLQNGLPVPFIYESSQHVWLDLFETIYGGYVIRVGGGRMGIAWDDVFAMDENGYLLYTVSVYSQEHAIWCDCCQYDFYDFYTAFYRNTGTWFSEQESERVSEDEYRETLIRYGIYNNAGRVELEWARLLQTN